MKSEINGMNRSFSASFSREQIEPCEINQNNRFRKICKAVKEDKADNYKIIPRSIHITLASHRTASSLSADVGNKSTGTLEGHDRETSNSLCTPSTSNSSNSCSSVF